MRGFSTSTCLCQISLFTLLTFSGSKTSWLQSAGWMDGTALPLTGITEKGNFITVPATRSQKGILCLCSIERVTNHCRYFADQNNEVYSDK